MKNIVTLICCWALLISGDAAHSHATPTTQLEALDHEIEHNLGSQKLYIRRALLLIDLGRYQDARLNLLTAEQLGSKEDTLWPYALLYRAQGESAKTESMLNAWLKQNPHFTPALEVRSALHAEQGKFGAAVSDYRLAIKYNRAPAPGDYIKLAKLLLQEQPKHIDRALAAIDEGLRTLNNPPQLQRYAIEQEISKGDYSAAIRRMDLLGKTLGSTPEWKNQKAQILESAGDMEGALALFEEALQQLNKNPKLTKKIKARRQLKVALQAKLSDLRSKVEQTSKHRDHSQLPG